MKAKFIMALCAVAACAGCNQAGDEMNEPAGAEAPSYQPAERTTNAPSTSTNQSGSSETQTNNSGNYPNAAP